MTQHEYIFIAVSISIRNPLRYTHQQLIYKRITRPYAQDALSPCSVRLAIEKTLPQLHA